MTRKLPPQYAGATNPVRSRIRFVWPAPGLPAFVQDEERIRAIVAQEDPDPEVVRGWAGRLALRGVDERIPIPLSVEAVEPWDSAAAEPPISGFVTLNEARRLSFVRVTLRAGQRLSPAAPRRVKLYDVLLDGQVVRPRSVAAFVPSGGDLRLAFAADLHVARAWDAIADAVARYAPDLVPGFLHPNRLLEKFIGEVNLLAAKGQLDLVVLGGDLVDHVYTRSRRQAPSTWDDSNVKLLQDSLARLQVPTITIPGNHDYRLYPGRPQICDTGALKIPASRTKALLQAAGLWSRRRLHLADLDALRVFEKSGRSDLTHYLSEIAPATDFSLTFQGVRLMFVATGRDITHRWREVEFARFGLFLRSLRHSLVCADSEGLSDAQVTQIASWVQAPGGAALFSHAPLLRVTHLAEIGLRVGCVDPRAEDKLASRIAFELRLEQAGVHRGVCFRNPAPLLRALAAAPGPVVMFSGHVHQATAIELDRSSLVLQTAHPVPPSDPDNTVTLLTAPSLGQVSDDRQQPPGYFIAHFKDGAMVSLDRRAL
ncbi:MAG: metallophosphoesterase [Verrucomicrobiota bacterium]